MYDDINREVGRKIKLIRETRLGISREELSRRLEISRPSVANIEEGRQNITVAQLYEFAGILGVSPLELLPNPTPLGDEHLSSVLPKEIAADLRAWVDKL